MVTKKPVTKERKETMKPKLTPCQKLNKYVNSIHKIVNYISKLKVSNEAREAAETYLANEICRITATGTDGLFSYEEEN